MASTEKGKKSRGGLKVMDYIVLLIVLICIVGAVIRIRQIDWFGEDEALSEYEIFFSVSNIAYTSEDAFVIGDTVTLAENGLILGRLKSVDSILPAVGYAADADGNVISISYPESTRIDVSGTILSMGLMNDGGYLLGGTDSIAPGKTYTVRTEHLDVTLTIMGIEEN